MMLNKTTSASAATAAFSRPLTSMGPLLIGYSCIHLPSTAIERTLRDGKIERQPITQVGEGSQPLGKPARGLRQHLFQRLNIFFQFSERVSIRGVGARELELLAVFFFILFELFARAFDGEVLGVEQALNLEQELDVALLVKAMTRGRLAGL